MRAKVTTAFSGAPDNEIYPKRFEVGSEVAGELARVAVKEKWAEPVKDKAPAPEQKPAEEGKAKGDGKSDGKSESKGECGKDTPSASCGAGGCAACS